MNSNALIILVALLLCSCGLCPAQGTGNNVTVGPLQHQPVVATQIWSYQPSAPGDDPAFPGWYQVTEAAAHWQPVKVVATTDGTANLPVRATRRRVACVNTSGETIYLGPGPGVTSSTGYPLLTSTTMALSTTGAIYATSASGSAVVWFIEAWD